MEPFALGVKAVQVVEVEMQESLHALEVEAVEVDFEMQADV